LKNQTTNKTILRNLILKNGMQNSWSRLLDCDKPTEKEN